MSNIKFIGDISHGEKYTDKNTGEDKWKNTRLGGLFKDEISGEYLVKMLGQWCKVWPPKASGDDYNQAKKAVQKTSQPHDDMSDEIPF